MPWLAPWSLPGSAQRAKVSRPARGFPQALAWAVIITAYCSVLIVKSTFHFGLLFPLLSGGSVIRHLLYIWFEYCIGNGLSLPLSRVIGCWRSYQLEVGTVVLDVKELVDRTLKHSNRFVPTRYWFAWYNRKSPNVRIFKLTARALTVHSALQTQC